MTTVDAAVGTDLLCLSELEQAPAGPRRLCLMTHDASARTSYSVEVTISPTPEPEGQYHRVLGLVYRSVKQSKKRDAEGKSTGEWYPVAEKQQEIPLAEWVGLRAREVARGRWELNLPPGLASKILANPSYEAVLPGQPHSFLSGRVLQASENRGAVCQYIQSSRACHPMHARAVERAAERAFDSEEWTHVGAEPRARLAWLRQVLGMAAPPSGWHFAEE